MAGSTVRTSMRPRHSEHMTEMEIQKRVCWNTNRELRGKHARKANDGLKVTQQQQSPLEAAQKHRVCVRHSRTNGLAGQHVNPPMQAKPGAHRGHKARPCAWYPPIDIYTGLNIPPKLLPLSIPTPTSIPTPSSIHPNHPNH